MKANCVGKPEIKDLKSANICPCCAREIDRIPLDSNVQNKKLGFLGSGFPLYFEFLKQCIIILVLFFITTADFNLFSNFFYGNDCEPATSENLNSSNVCILTFISRMSLANKRSSGELMTINSMLNFVAILTILTAIHIFKKN